MVITALAAALALASTPPTDGRPLVVIVLPASPSAAEASSVEASIRLRGELDGAGVEVRTIEGAAAADTPEALQRIAREQHAVAAIALVWVPGAETTDLWIADRRTGNFVHKHVDARNVGERSIEVLAIQTAELIRASLVDVFLSPPPAPPPAIPPTVALSPPAPSRPRQPRRWLLRAAAGPTAMLVRGAGPSLAGSVDVGLLIDRRWLVRMAASGLGTKQRLVLDANTNWSELSQSVVTAQVQYRRALPWRLSVGAGLGAGLLYVLAEGHGSAPYQGVSVSQTSFCGAAGLAVNLALGARFELSLEGHALVGVPPADVWAGSSGPAKTGQPTVLITLALAVLP